MARPQVADVKSVGIYMKYVQSVWISHVYLTVLSLHSHLYGTSQTAVTSKQPHPAHTMQQYPSNWHVLPSVQLYTLTINNYAIISVLRPDRTQAVNRRLHTVEPRVQSQSCPYGICNEQGGIGAGISLGTSGFPLSITIPLTYHIYLSSGADQYANLRLQYQGVSFSLHYR
jgi:hypothetical protein